MAMAFSFSKSFSFSGPTSTLAPCRAKSCHLRLQRTLGVTKNTLRPILKDK